MKKMESMAKNRVTNLCMGVSLALSVRATLKPSGLNTAPTTRGVARTRLVVHAGITQTIHNIQRCDHRDTDSNHKMDAQLGNLKEAYA
jgi:hypothetical protein